MTTITSEEVAQKLADLKMYGIEYDTQKERMCCASSEKQVLLAYHLMQEAERNYG